MVFRTGVRLMRAKNQNQNQKAIEVKEGCGSESQSWSITRTIFNILKERGPLTIAQTWDQLQVQEVGLKELKSKSQMKTVMRWMRERQKLKMICNHVGSQKQFLYTTWFTKPNANQDKPSNYSSNGRVKC